MNTLKAFKKKLMCVKLVPNLMHFLKKNLFQSAKFFSKCAATFPVSPNMCSHWHPPGSLSMESSLLNVQGYWKF